MSAIVSSAAACSKRTPGSPDRIASESRTSIARPHSRSASASCERSRQASANWRLATAVASLAGVPASPRKSHAAAKRAANVAGTSAAILWRRIQ